MGKQLRLYFQWSPSEIYCFLQNDVTNHSRVSSIRMLSPIKIIDICIAHYIIIVADVMKCCLWL